MYIDGCRILEIELSTKCNAACPQCSRNYYGGITYPGLPLVNLSLKSLQKNISKSFLEKLDEIALVGTYGDPCMHTDLISVVNWIQQSTNASIRISTNGSLRSKKFWSQLGNLMREQDRVMFCIDGLKDTNHIYRRNTNFNKIIDNLSAFNNAGGRSIWTFIVFEHNEHQVDAAKKMSNELSCHGFIHKKTNRFVNYTNELVKKSPVMDNNSNIIYWLAPPKNKKYLNVGYQTQTQTQTKEYLKTTKITCMVLKNKIVSISGEGYVLPCGFLQDRLYGYESESHPDRKQLIELINKAGGFEAININHNSIENIITGNFFNNIKESWTNDNRLERCASKCGEDNNFSKTGLENIILFKNKND